MAHPRKAHNAPVILVVEDEMLTRILAVAAFDDAGFTVMEADNADQADKILQSYADNVQVLFTDVEMPGAMTGARLMLHTRLHWPWIGLVAASGKPKPGGDEMPADTRFFQKPYDIGQIVAHVRELAPVG